MHSLIRQPAAITCFCMLLVIEVFLAADQCYANEFLDDFEGAHLQLGTLLTGAQVDALPKHVFPDGAGLPNGSGSVQYGAELYASHCAKCHGSSGQGGKAMELVGDRQSLVTKYPDRGIAVFWPHAATLYEYINRSMPPETPMMFSNDELYSLIAYLLHLNGLVKSDFVLDKRILISTTLPNVDGFITIAR